MSCMRSADRIGERRMTAVHIVERFAELGAEMSCVQFAYIHNR